MFEDKNFKHFISLGYFCSVALNLDELGLREFSSPFDWVISDFDYVLKAMENNFCDFMKFENLYQSRKHRERYYDALYKIWFYHDFNCKHSLASQYDSVYQKYQRRIARFKRVVCEPTLFIRYIVDNKKLENGQTELDFINTHKDYINSIIKLYNPNNEILFIGNANLQSNIVHIFNVEKYKNDCVNRNPLLENKYIYELLSMCNIDTKNENILRYKEKNENKNNLFKKIRRKLTKILRLHWFKYRYDKVVDE